MTINELIKLIEEYSINHGLDRSRTEYGQMRKTLEEIAELSIGILKGDRARTIDAVGYIFATLVMGNMHSSAKNQVNIADVIDEVRENEVLDDYNRGYQAKSVSRLFYSGYLLERGKFIHVDYYHKESIYNILHELLIVCAVWNLELEDCIKSAYKNISKFEEEVKEFTE